MIIFLFNLTGQELVTVFEGNVYPKYFEMTWDLKDSGGHKMPAGIYLISINDITINSVQKVIIR